MSDIVVRLPIRDEAEDAEFGSFLSRFLDAAAGEAQRLADSLDAPFLMVRNEPQRDCDVRVLTFQAGEAAQAFARGWSRVAAVAGAAPSA